MTGYERYYIDIEGFWRQLYNPNFAVEEIEYQEKIDNKAAEIADIERKMAETTDKAELKILQQELETANNVKSNLEYDLSQFILEKENYYEEGHKHEFWHKNVYEHPETLNFWFDFLDMEGELSQFNVRAVGPRSKAVNETIIKSIYFRETPEVIFIKSNEEKEETTGYKYIQM